MNTTINKKMKKQKLTPIYALILLVIVAACGTPTTDELPKQDQLIQYKKELHALTQKITELETELKSGEKVELVNVVTTQVQAESFKHYIDVTARVEADQEVNVSPEGSGKILDILVREGQRVQKGEVLAKLNTDILEQSMEEMKISLDLAQTTFERQKNLWDQKIGSEIQFLQAKSSKESMERRLAGLEAQLDMAEVKAPVDGVVDVIYQKKGEIASPQIPFAKVVNIDKIKIYGDVAETYITKVKQGDKVSINFPALNMDTEGSIFNIGNFIDPNNRTFRIRVNMKNNKGMIKPNLMAIMKIIDYKADSAIIIPSILIKEDFRGKYTYLAKKDGKTQRAKKVYIKPGVSNNNMTEVREGIQAGDFIISEGFEQIVEGTAVQF